ncbi:Crp/Fnr family transcriptional regulator [Leptospira idonii]|nr:Crp/Fnr family transcriptional regulator [Leptospira idonii]
MENLRSFFFKKGYSKGKSFIEKEDSFNKIGFVESGLFKLVYENSEKEYIKDFCGEGDVIGAYSSLLRQTPPVFRIVSLEDSFVWEADFLVLEARFGNQLPFVSLLKSISDNLYLKKEKRESDFILLSAEQRYLEFVQTRKSLIHRLKDYEIASYLGITNVAFSRIKSKLFNLG